MAPPPSVTNWTCAGGTKGFSHDHTDYYLLRKHLANEAEARALVRE